MRNISKRVLSVIIVFAMMFVFIVPVSGLAYWKLDLLPVGTSGVNPQPSHELVDIIVDEELTDDLINGGVDGLITDEGDDLLADLEDGGIDISDPETDPADLEGEAGDDLGEGIDEGGLENEVDDALPDETEDDSLTDDEENEETAEEISDNEDATVIGTGRVVAEKNDGRVKNITLAAKSVDGVVLKPSGSFSFNKLIGARTKRRGYERALNGRGVKVYGGGVAQLASAIYLAIKDSDLFKITEKYTYGSKYSGSYVSRQKYAILVDHKSGRDFSFRYTGKKTARIAIDIDGREVVCTVYEE